MYGTCIYYTRRYRATVEKVVSPKEIQVLYIDFGNVSVCVCVCARMHAWCYMYIHEEETSNVCVFVCPCFSVFYFVRVCRGCLCLRLFIYCLKGCVYKRLFCVCLEVDRIFWQTSSTSTKLYKVTTLHLFELGIWLSPSPSVFHYSQPPLAKEYHLACIQLHADVSWHNVYTHCTVTWPHVYATPSD